MSNVSSHIISKFRWNTLFDKKERSSELQERLSAWSRINMPKEVADVFDKVCPPEQTWRIQSLEIDLGLINYTNLEFELSTRLRAQLNEKLTDLIIYANRGGRNFEILSEDTSYIYLISSFLLNGLMPWSYKTTDGSVNEILAYELQNNRQQVIEMLQSVGVTHENVRKRIAWQISEPNIIKIIEGLEPNNHTQIIDFSNELTKIQSKETIVQTSIRDFKKQLWFWILNYLLTERGTVFNKIAYMKSTIRQMAAHYNIGYAELLALIERAVNIVSKNYGLKADFLQTIKAIVSEEKIYDPSIGSAPVDDTVNLWTRLSEYIKGSSSSVSVTNRKEINELIMSLSKQNSAKFKAVLIAINYDNHLFNRFFTELNKASLQVVLRTLNENAAGPIIEKIEFLIKAGRKLSLNIGRNALKHIALQFLYANKNAAIDSKAFMSYCIGELGKSTGLSKVDLLDRLTNARLQNINNVSLATDTHAELSALYINEADSNPVFISIRFADLIEDLIARLTAGIIDKTAFLSRQKLLTKNIRLYPKTALNTLIQYQDKDGLQQLLPYILDSYVIQVLVKQVGVLDVFVWLQHMADEIESNAAYSSLGPIIDEKLLPIALNVIILSSESKSEAQLNLILRELYLQISEAEVVVIKGILNHLSQLKKIPAIEFVPYRTTFYKANDLTIIEQIKQLITSPNKQVEIGKILQNNFNHPQIIEARKYKNQFGSTLLNYLIPQGNTLMEILIKQYMVLITNKLSNIGSRDLETKLTELYWQCVTDYTMHRGQTDRLKKIFKTTVLSQFNISNQDISDTASSSNSFLPQGKALMDLVIKEYAAILSHILINDTQPGIVNRLTKLYKEALTNYTQHKGSGEALVNYFRISVITEFSVADEHILPQLIYLKRSNQSLTSQDKQQMHALIKQYTLLIAAGLKTVSTHEIRLHLINIYQEIRLQEILKNNRFDVFAIHFRKAALLAFNITDERLSPVIIYSNKAKDSISAQPGSDFDLLIKTYAKILYGVSSQLSEAGITKQLIDIYQECLENNSVPSRNTQLAVRIFKSAVEHAFEITDSGILSITSVINLASKQDKIYKLISRVQLSENEIFNLIEIALISSASVVRNSNVKIKLSELINLAISVNPTKLREIIAHIPYSPKRLELVKASISFNRFALWIMSDTSGSLSQAIEAVRIIHDIVLLTASHNLADSLTNQFWQQSWKMIARGSCSAYELNELIKQTLYQLTEQIDIESIKSVIQRNNISVNAVLKGALLACSPAFVTTSYMEGIATSAVQLKVAESKNLLYELSYAIIIQKQVPVWFNISAGQNIKDLLNELIISHPVKVLLVLKQEVVPEQQMQWLSQSININNLIAAITHLDKSKQSLLHVINQFYYFLAHSAVNGITAKEMQYILFRKIIKAWSTDNWRILSSENIWNELLWDVCVKRGLNKADFIRDISKSQSYLPPSLLISFNYLKDQNNTIKTNPAKTELTKPIKKMLEKQTNSTVNKGGIPVKNAGMVLLNNYIPMLFERMGLTADKKFLNTDIQCNAVHYLQYVVTGLTYTDEALLPLNKVLCGVPLSHPIPDGIAITNEQILLINSLIQAIIGYWNAIGSTSIDGFRGNWLVRDGLLVELDERWELTVEKRAYDILINKSPFSFSIIKYPWMDKPLHVQWPY